jgi:hypothetical protein
VTAAQSTDVELILISFDLFGQGWALRDTLANLKADSRTTAIPIIIYGPLDFPFRRPNQDRDYPAMRLLVQPVDSTMLQRQIKTLPLVLGGVERARYAHEPTDLLIQVAKARNSPRVVGLSAAKPALTGALSRAQTKRGATTAICHLPDPDAPRSLANSILDPFRPTSLRSQSTTEFVHCIQPIDRLISASQEARVASMLHEDGDSELHDDLESIIRALNPMKTRMACRCQIRSRNQPLSKTKSCNKPNFGSRSDLRF